MFFAFSFTQFAALMSSCFEISKAKKADDATNLLVFGYIRTSNGIHKISANIPDLICFIVLVYYMEQEYFDKPGKDCKISDDKMNVTRMNGSDYNSTTYCKQWIPSTSNVIVTWKFKIKNIGNWSQIIFGITCNDDCQDSDFTERNKTATYALESNGD